MIHFLNYRTRGTRTGLGARHFMSALFIVAAGALGLQSACSFVVGANNDQCENDGDCTTRGPAFAGTMCGPQKTCIVNGSFCATNATCNTDPTNPGICNKTTHACVPLYNSTGDCNQIIGNAADLNDDNVILFGFMLAQTGAQGPSGKTGILATQMALNDWTSSEGGSTGAFPAATSGGTPRHVVFVACDDEVNPIPVAQHLVNDLNIQAIIGPQPSGIALPVATQVTTEAKVMIDLPVANTPVLANIDNKQYVFRLNASDPDQATAQAQITSFYFENQLRTKNTSLASASVPLRVAIMHASNASGNTTAGEIEADPKFTWNGKSYTDNNAAGNFLDVPYGDPQGDPNDFPAKEMAAIATLVAFKPHVVLYDGLQETVGIWSAIETQWTEPTFRPYHLLNGATIVVPFTYLTNYNDTGMINEDLRERTFIINDQPEPTEPHYAAFLTRYNSLYPVSMYSYAQSGGPVPPVTFDFAYLLFYALMANADQPITGTNLVAGMKRLQGPGLAINPDLATSIEDGITELRQGKNIVYTGASGPCDFNTQNDATESSHIFCFSPGGVAAAPPNGAEVSGIDLDKSTGLLTGTLNCR